MTKWYEREPGRLRDWLKNGEKGRKYLLQLLKEVLWDPDFQELHEALELFHERHRHNVVVEIFSDGWVEVYGPASVRATIVNRPEVFDKQQAAMLDAAIARWVIPYAARSVYKGRVLAGDMVKKTSVQDWLDRERLLRSLKEVEEAVAPLAE